MPLPIPRSKELDHTYSPWNCRVYIIFYDNRITFVSLINPSVVTSNLAFWAFSSLVFAVLMEEVLILAVGISIGLPTYWQRQKCFRNGNFFNQSRFF